MKKLDGLDIATVRRNDVYMIYIKGHITKLQYNEYIYKQLIYLMDQNKNR